MVASGLVMQPLVAPQRSTLAGEPAGRRASTARRARASYLLRADSHSAEVAQLAERLLAKEKVASSSLVFRSIALDPSRGPAAAGSRCSRTAQTAMPRDDSVLPKWRNGRRGGLKNRWGATPVWVRIPPSAPYLALVACRIIRTRSIL